MKRRIFHSNYNHVILIRRKTIKTFPYINTQVIHLVTPISQSRAGLENICFQKSRCKQKTRNSGAGMPRLRPNPMLTLLPSPNKHQNATCVTDKRD